MKLIQTLDAKIESLEAGIAEESRIIADAIANKQVGDGYWQKRHAMQERLQVAKAFRKAVAEVVS